MNVLKICLAATFLLGVAACGKKGDVKPPSRTTAFSAISVPFLADFTPFLMR